MQLYKKYIKVQQLLQKNTILLVIYILLIYVNSKIKLKYILLSKMNQRHYSPDQINNKDHGDSQQKHSKRLRQGGSTSKMLQSFHRYVQDDIIIGDYRYRPSDEIGAGYSSRVYKGYGKDKQQYAIKVIEMKRFSSSGLQMLENEIQILKKLSHPNIIKLYYVHKAQNFTYLVTQLCRQGDLLQFMTKKGRLNEEIASFIMADVIQAVKYLMKVGVVHRDIKPANILRSEKTWKLADFGFSIMSKQQVRTKQNVGTPLYMPLESLVKNLYSPESDIFAIGVMYYEMIIGITPWQCRSEKELIKKLATVPFSVPEKYKLSSHLKYLIQKMCSIDKTVRMQKQEFCQLNIKNFVCLKNFNDPLTSSARKLQEFNKKIHGSPIKLKKSKSKNKMVSKQKELKVRIDKQYKLGRRKKSEQKPSNNNKKSVQKQTYPKTATIKEQPTTGSSLKSATTGNSIIPSLNSLMPQSQIQNLDRFEIINQKIILNQLDYCRFMYYFVHNSHHLPLAEDALKRFILVVFKHIIKLIKQLLDGKFNYFKLPNWDTFKQCQRYKTILNTIQQYSEKYQKQYLKYLKESEISVIKEVNQKFSELGSIDPLSISFYRKLQALISSSLKDCVSLINIPEEQKLNDNLKANIEAIKAMLRYYRWIELNAKNFENYIVQKNNQIVIVKAYKNLQITRQDTNKLFEEIRIL